MDQLTTSQSSSTERLRNARLARGYSLDDLAIATGLTIVEIAAAENGKGPAQHVERIEHALGQGTSGQAPSQRAAQQPRDLDEPP